MTDSFVLRKNFARLAENPPRPAMDSYDPNDARSFKTEHVFRLTFQSWGASAVIETEVKGNVLGFGNLDTAIGNVYEALPENERGDPYLMLTAPNGDTMLVDERGGDRYGPLDEDALKDMLVRAEIVALQPVKEMAKAA